MGTLAGTSGARRPGRPILAVIALSRLGASASKAGRRNFRFGAPDQAAADGPTQARSQLAKRKLNRL